MKRKYFRTSQNRLICMGNVSALFLAAIFLAMAPAGCGRRDDGKGGFDKAGQTQLSTASQYPAALSAESTPKEVAQVLIQALEENDRATLLGLVAVKSAVADIDAIFRKYGRRSPIDQKNAVALAVQGWAATYHFFKVGETDVMEETVEGDTAVVYANGKALDASSRRLEISLVREDGLWKVRAGLHSLAGAP